MKAFTLNLDTGWSQATSSWANQANIYSRLAECVCECVRV